MSERFGHDITLLEKLAAGGMAEVFRAKQKGYGGFEKTVALKRILPNFASNEDFKQMFRMEANLSGNLQHPNIVQVFGNGEVQGYLYLLMEFVDGRNVRQLLARCDKTKTKIPIPVSCYLVAEAAKGLDYAHRYKDDTTGEVLEIIHRDMSPQNVMLGFEGTVKIVDFGIAKAAARSGTTRAGVLKGKFNYMSPEQANGQKLDRRTDIFALGIILFELITQRRLFSSDDDLRTLQLVKDCRVPRPSKYNPAITPALDRIILKALSQDRNDRYATADDFHADIQHHMNQKYPKFLPRDLARFISDVFKEDIVEDKKRRERMAAEAPAILSQVSMGQERGNESRAPGVKDRDKTILGDEEIKTMVSHIESLESLEENAHAHTSMGAADEGEVGHKEGILSEESSVVEKENSLVKKDNVFLEKEDSAVNIDDLSQSRFVHEGDHKNEASVSGKSVASKKPQEQDTNTNIETHTNLNVPTKIDMNVHANLSLQHSARSLVSEHAPRPLPSRPQAKISRDLNSGASKRKWLYSVAVVVLLAVFLGGKDSSTETSSQMKGVQQLTEVLPERTEIVPQGTESPSSIEESSLSLEETAVAPEQASPPVAELATVSFVEGRGPSALNLKGPKGLLTIVSIPNANRILVNGKLLVDQNGEPVKTPVDRLAVPVGKYHFELFNSAYGNVKWSGSIEVESDRALKRDVVLK